MPGIPRARSADSTLAFLSQGYRFISRECDALGADRFATRLMLRPVICARGEDAARMFYGEGNFTRKGAMPRTVLRLLQDKGSVQQLDAAAHRRRKALFVELLMDNARIDALRESFRGAWREAQRRWVDTGSVVLFDEMPLVLLQAVREWIGLPPEAGSDRELADELATMIENAGQVSPGTFRALLLRRRHERRIRKALRDVRAGRHALAPDAPLAVIAGYRDIDGRLLSIESAAVEAINVLRPVVAISRYIGFAALALGEHPRWREAFAAGEFTQLEPFVEEVRRLYPFFPAVGGRVCRPFAWRGHRFAEGDWVMLDLHGTNHDPRLHPEPETFRPERNLSWRDQGFGFIPQGGGDTHRTHRCPGEAITVTIVAEAVRLMCQELHWEMPPQDLSIDLARMPARPASGIVLHELRSAARI